MWYLRKKYGVHARKNESEISCIIEAIQNEMEMAGSMLGYRLLWIRLRTKYRLNVRRDTVMMLLKLIDPEGSDLRRMKKLQRRTYRSKVHIVF